MARWQARPAATPSIGETRFIARAGGQRYVRISLDDRIGEEVAVAFLGHELQHAWEIAQASWVIDEETLERLYRQIGHIPRHGGRDMRVDTPAGPATGRRVARELRASRAPGSRGEPEAPHRASVRGGDPAKSARPTSVELAPAD